MVYRSVVMSRYFFHLYDDLVVLDEEGTELPDDLAAHEHALRCAREMACAEIKSGKLSLGHRIEVADEQGETVLVLPFKSAFEVGE